jgi:hypothetical protein
VGIDTLHSGTVQAVHTTCAKTSIWGYTFVPAMPPPETEPRTATRRPTRGRPPRSSVRAAPCGGPQGVGITAWGRVRQPAPLTMLMR